jgi:hypothetical protein
MRRSNRLNRGCFPSGRIPQLLVHIMGGREELIEVRSRRARGAPTMDSDEEEDFEEGDVSGGEEYAELVSAVPRYRLRGLG